MKTYQKAVPVRWLSSWTGLPRSNWYYKSLPGKQGAKPSHFTRMRNGELVSNEEVVEAIKKILSQEFICYGYEKVTWELHEMGYIINKKKVYRLMKEAHLLHGRNKISSSGKRPFVKTRKIEAQHPLQYLVMDIKYVWIQGEKRNAYLLTVMDVYSRKVMAHRLKYSIRQYDVILLLDGILQKFQTKQVIIRNDNGSQFIAHNVRKYLKSQSVHQEFTHIATPEENAYIESLYSTLEREVIKRYWFDTLQYAKWKINGYYKTYNEKRKHRSLKRKSPDQVWNEYFMENGNHINQQNLLNPLEKSVQEIRG